MLHSHLVLWVQPYYTLTVNRGGQSHSEIEAGPHCGIEVGASSRERETEASSRE
jgi:hypothetical protein